MAVRWACEFDQRGFLCAFARLFGTKGSPMTMIRRISRIRDFQAFSNWRANSETATLGRVNLIYGQNGSGKSTLASLLAKAARGEADAHGIELLVDADGGGGQTRPVTDALDPFWKKVRVFNGEFVKANLRFDHEGGSEAEALVVLGKEQIDAEDRLTELRGLVEALDRELPKWRSQKSASDTQSGNILSNTARRVVEDLRSLATYRATNVYSKTQVASILNGDRSVLSKKSTDLIEDLALVQATNKPELKYSPSKFAELSALVTDVRAMTLKTAAGQAIEELKSDPDLSAWAQTGLPLHEHRDTCAFCGNVLNVTRLDDLRAHFDDSAKKLQLEVEQLAARLRAHAELAAGEHDRLPSTTEFFEDLQPEFRKLLKSHSEEVTEYTDQIALLVSKCIQKSNRLFDSYPTVIDDPADSPDLSKIEALVTRHNGRSRRFDVSRSDAGRRVELYRVADSEADYDKARGVSSSLASKILDGDTDHAKFIAEITRLSQPRGDAKSLADQLTRDVARLLGRGDLTFELRDGKYVIQRNGGAAEAMSEGEKTAVSLLYFLCSLNDENAEEDLVVIVDDPVSSLDSNILVGASAHLWSELVTKADTRQVFLLTHNFELFRIWSNQIDSRRGGGASTMQELRMASAVGSSNTIQRRPLFTNWPSKDNFHRKTRSEYHFLFWKVGSSLIALRDAPDLISEIEAMALIPNAARKMLEGFLAFRFPQHLGDFEGSVDAALEGQDSAMKAQIVRFVHHHSHNESGDTGAPIQPGEALSILFSVFELMKVVDTNHFSAMCEALDLDQAELSR